MEPSVLGRAGLCTHVLLPCAFGVTPSLHQISRVYCSRGGFTELCLEAELVFSLSVWALRCTNAALAARLSLSLLMEAEWGEQTTASLDGQAQFSQHCSGFTLHPPSEPSWGVQ